MSTHDLAFRPTLDAERLGHETEPQAFLVIGGARSGRPSPLRFAGAPRPEIEADHRYRSDVPPATIFAVTGHVLRAGGLLVRDDSVFWRDDCWPGYLRDVLQPGTRLPDAWAHGLRGAPLRTIDLEIPCAVPTHPNFVYGHFLLEMLPKLWLLDGLQRCGNRFAVAVPTTMPAWVWPFLSLYVHERDLVRYDPRLEQVRAPSFLVPAMLNLNYYLHPAMNLVADDLVARAAPAGQTTPTAHGRRLLLSRRTYQGGAFSALDAAREVEAAMDEFDFEILHPEDLSIAEQMSAYRGASMILGEYGSALHNALFAPRGCSVIAINPFNTVQSRISALRHQPLGVVDAVDGPVQRVNAGGTPPAPIRIDLDSLKRLVAEMASAEPQTRPVARNESARPVALRTLDRLPLGDYLSVLETQGSLARSIEVAPSQPRRRGGFLFAAKIDEAIAPFGHLFSSPDYRDYTSARIVCAELRGAMIVGSDGLVALRGRIVADTTHGVEAWRSESLIASLNQGGELHLKQSVTIPSPDRREVFCGFTGGWRNIDHWFTECLPRLYMFIWLKQRQPGMLLAMPAFDTGSLQERTLRLLGIEPADILTVDREDVVAPETLWVLSGIDVWQPPTVVRDAARAFAGAARSANPHATGRLYLASDNGPSRVTNMDAVQPLLASYGVQILRPLQSGLDSLLAAMAGARVVVGESGSGLAAVAFCGEGTRVIELFNPAGPQPAIWGIASLCDLAYGYVVGQHTPEPAQETAPDGNSSYAVDLDQLTIALATACA